MRAAATIPERSMSGKTGREFWTKAHAETMEFLVRAPPQNRQDAIELAKELYIVADFEWRTPTRSFGKVTDVASPRGGRPWCVRSEPQ
jgi:hypothetical protein